MRSYMFVAFVFVCIIFSFSDGSHFRGGIVTWRALNTTPSGSTADILIHQRYSWRRSFWSNPNRCTAASIASQTPISVSTDTLDCLIGTCTSISTDVACTDFSIGTDFSSGERYDVRVMNIGQSYTVSYTSNAWFNLAMGGGGIWQVTGKIDLTIRADGKINTSPVTSTLPIIYKEINVQHVHIVQMADADSTDTLKCRWSTISSNFNGINECGSVCAPSLPTYTLIQENCTLIFSLNIDDYYAVALQIEDFYTSSSITPMSSVPIQFLFFGQQNPGGCSTPPTIIGVRPNLACIGTPIGVFVNETVIAEVGCSGKTIIDFTTSSPVGMSQTTIMNISPNIYVINLLWTPTIDQSGPQGFCAGAVDNTNVQSVPWCITFLVGYSAPNLQTPILVQGSASPIGTIFSNHTRFSIQSTNGAQVNRPGRNGTNVYFTDATMNNTVVLQYDCGWSLNVTYSGDTLLIYAPYPWIPGHRYYVTFDSGVSSGTEFCRAESAPIMDPNFWVFDIWNPSLSSTTSTTTTAPTAPTITTRGISSTTPIANLTTTGIILTSTTTRTTTTSTSTSSTTTTTSTTITTTSTTTSAPEIKIMTPEDFVKACQQPVAIGTAITLIATIPIHVIGLFVLFIKLNQFFNPSHINVRQRALYFQSRS